MSRQHGVPTGFHFPEKSGRSPWWLEMVLKYHSPFPFISAYFGSNMKLDQFNIFTTGHILGNTSIKNMWYDFRDALSGWSSWILWDPNDWFIQESIQDCKTMAESSALPGKDFKTVCSATPANNDFWYSIPAYSLIFRITVFSWERSGIPGLCFS